MNRTAKITVLLSLIENLEENGSWCGETHIQKSCYFLQEMLGAELEYNFILYKHGPYSFDLSDELGALRADSLLKVVPQHPYGPRLLPTENWENLKSNFPKTLKKHKEQINFLAQWLKNKGVSDLEKLATAYYVTQHNKNASQKDRAEEICSYKPHISCEEALNAVSEVEAHLSH